jgi:transposase
MSNPFWLTGALMSRLQPFSPKSCGKPRSDDRSVLSGILSTNRNGLQRRNAPRNMGRQRPFCNRWKRWGGKGVFARITENLASEKAVPKTVMFGATSLKAHRTATSLKSRKGG